MSTPEQVIEEAIEATEARLTALRDALAALKGSASAPSQPAKRREPGKVKHTGRFSNAEKNRAVDRAHELGSGKDAAQEIGCRPELIEKWRADGFGSGLGVPGNGLPPWEALDLAKP